MNIFDGTAVDYALYRPPYPSALIDAITAAAPDGTILDLGCGTGNLAIPLDQRGRAVIAVDVDADMVTQGRCIAPVGSRIDWRLQEAESVVIDDDSVAAVTVGAAFHWMDRDRIAVQAKRWLCPRGLLAVAGSLSTWTSGAPWQAEVRKVIEQWLGPERRAGASGTFKQSGRRHEEVLREAGFEVTQATFATTYAWTADTVLGYLRSTSFAGRQVLREHHGEFEQSIRDCLLAYDFSGHYPEVIEFYLIIARVPARTMSG